MKGRRELLFLALLLVLAAGVRIAYVLALDVPTFDPWRHLALIRNLREGEGFTLFAGQPYIWYGRCWYRLCALFPESVGPEWIAACFSALAVPGVFLFARDRERPESLVPALVAGVLMAIAGPVVAFTCHYGQEGLALFLVVASLLLGRMRGGWGFAVAAGLVFGLGVSLRMNFAFLVFLFLPFLRDRKRAIALAAGIALPLVFSWFRNYQVIAENAFVFTWDGLATRSADYGLLSTLVVQMHPAVQEGLTTLHAAIVPDPEWLRDRAGMNWDLLAFMVCGVGCLIASRRWSLLAAGGATLAYFLFFDASNSSHFFRLYLPLFPVFFLAVGDVVGKLHAQSRPAVRGAGWALAVVLPLAGMGLLAPPEMTPREMLQPPAGTLTADRYLVNSGLYRPSCLMLDHPDVAFAGLPLYPEQLDEFRRAFPEYRHVLWNAVGSVQQDLLAALAARGDYEASRPLANAHGMQFMVLRSK